MRLRDPNARESHRAGAYLGLQGYASILAMTRQPITPLRLMQATGVSDKSANRVLKSFQHLGLVHRVGWEPLPHGADQPVYLFGPGENAPARPTRRGTAMPYVDHVPAITPRMAKFAAVIDAMQAPTTFARISEESGLNPSRLKPLLEHMRSPEIRLVHVAAWDEVDACRRPLRQYLFGEGRDAKRPKRQRALRDRVAADLRRSTWACSVMQLKRMAGFQAARCDEARNAPHITQRA